MTPIQASVDQFLERVRKAARDLKDFTGRMETGEQELRDAIAALARRLDGRGAGDPQPAATATGQSIRQLVNEMVRTYHEQVARWTGLADRHIDGKQFVNQFERSIIIVVFGQVNSGKSSLGNFVAGLPFRATDIRYASRTPEFLVYDWSDRSRQRGPVPLAAGEFRVNATEETSTIQYYTLEDGMTWVDTPGIHSINQANEELARQYVEYADLVLFVVPSSAPGKADELRELERLMAKDKPLQIILSKSDQSMLVDYVDGKDVTVLLPKEEKVRHQQEEYVAQSLSERTELRYFKERRYVSVSVRLAEKAVAEENAEFFGQSNIPLLFDSLGSVMGASAIALKAERPKREFNNAIREILAGFDADTGRVQGVRDLKVGFQRLLEEIQTHKEKALAIRTTFLHELKATALPDIESRLVKLGMAFDGGRQVTAEEISRVVEDEVREAFNQLLPRRLKKVLAEFQHRQVESLGIQVQASYETQYREMEYELPEVRTGHRDPRGFIETIQWLIFDKKFTESKVKMVKQTERIKVGNNTGDVIQQVFSQMESQLSAIVERNLREIVQEYFGRHEHVVSGVITDLTALEHRLEKLTIK